MRKILYLVALALLMSSCARRELSYISNPTIDVVVNVRWVDLSETPTGMSVYCYSDAGGSPTIKQTNNVSDVTLSLGVGSYKVVVFNQIPTEYTTINFTGFDSYETAEVNTISTKSTWYKSKADDELSLEPDELAIATYHDLEITQEDIDKIMEEYQTYKSSDDVTLSYHIEIDVYPAIVIRKTRVTVAIDQINNLADVRASLYGMASGYDISEQTSHSDCTTHLLEDWTMTKDANDITQGEVVAYFNCFGIPETTTYTRVELDESWGGTMNLEMLLLDGETIIETEHVLYDKVTLMGAYLETENKGSKNKSSGDDDSLSEDDLTEEEEDIPEEESSEDDSGVDISIDIDDGITLPDVEISTGGESSSGGFDVNVSDWGDEVKVDVDM